MLKINIETTQANAEDMADMLRQIADSIESGGFTSGHYPTWDLEKVCDTCDGKGKVFISDNEGDIKGPKNCPDCTPEDDMDMTGATPGDR